MTNQEPDHLLGSSMTNQEPDHLLRMLQRLENLFFLARGKLKWQKNEVLLFFFFLPFSLFFL